MIPCRSATALNPTTSVWRTIWTCLSLARLRRTILKNELMRPTMMKLFQRQPHASVRQVRSRRTLLLGSREPLPATGHAHQIAPRTRMHTQRMPQTRSSPEGQWHNQFNYSAILGSLAAGALANSYHPSRDRGVGLVLRSALIGIGGTRSMAYSRSLCCAESQKIARDGSPYPQAIDNQTPGRRGCSGSEASQQLTRSGPH